MVGNVFQSVELSMIGLKISGVVLSLVGVIYFLFMRRKSIFGQPDWKKVTILSCALAFFNAGLAISFGKMAFLVTPLIIFCTLILWSKNQMPLWTSKHVLGFVSLFTAFSMIFFVVTAGIFFHIAVRA